MTESDRKATREHMLDAAEELLESTGRQVTRAMLAQHLDVSRARVDAIFPEEPDLFDGAVERYFAPYVAIMEDVVAADLPPERKLYEFVARRFVLVKQRWQADPALFELYNEVGSDNFEQIRGYIELADHYLAEVIAQAQADGYFPGFSIDQALSLVNQMLSAYMSPQMMAQIGDKLTEEKLAIIVDTVLAGLSAEDRGARGVTGLRAVE